VIDLRARFTWEKTPNLNHYYYRGLILPLYPELCCIERDLYSVSSGSRDISVLLSLLHFFFKSRDLF